MNEKLIISNVFKQKIIKENASRLQIVDMVLVIAVVIQTTVYYFTFAGYNDFHLILVKAFIILAGLIVLVVLQLVKLDNFIKLNFSKIILIITAFLMIFLAILNTFFSQKFTSDISIYVLVLMAVMSANHIEVKFTAIIITINFLLFAFGMKAFQNNSHFLYSNIFNGALTNILAFFISIMFYQYSIKDFQDKIEIDQKNKRLRELSEKDDLTGLYNKRTIYLRLEEMIEKSREDKSSIFLGILDLDHFKEVNDKYGHPFGDEVLKEVAEKIQHNVREDDIAGRYGGDEFVIIFHNISHSVVTQVMTRILEEVNKLEFGTIKLSFSCGVAVWKGESCEKLFERADEYMYDVKRFGKNDIKIEPIWALK